MVSRYRGCGYVLWRPQFYLYCGIWRIYGGILPDAPGPEKSVRASGVYDRKRKESGFHQALSHAVEWDDHVLEEDFVFGMVTNSRSVGGFKGLSEKRSSLMTENLK